MGGWRSFAGGIEMAIFKRGNVYWYHFLWNGQHVQKSTAQGNLRVARQIEAAHRGFGKRRCRNLRAQASAHTSAIRATLLGLRSDTLGRQAAHGPVLRVEVCTLAGIYAACGCPARQN